MRQPSEKRQVQALLEEARQIDLSSHGQKALAETEWNLAHIMMSMWQNLTYALPHAVHSLSLAVNHQNK